MKSPTKQKNTTDSKTGLPGQPVLTPVETASGLNELFTDGIKAMYWSENHLVKSLPKMISSADSSKLKSSLTNHLELTKKHASRLEDVFELLGVKKQAKKCDATEGIVMAGEHVIENTTAGTEARDTGIIMSSLKVENFELTSYNGLIQLAATLGKADIAEKLKQNMDDEAEAIQLLTAMSLENAQQSSSDMP